MVINPKIYMEQLEELGLEDLEIEPSSRGRLSLSGRSRTISVTLIR